MAWRTKSISGTVITYLGPEDNESNLEIREFSQAITNFVDSSGLPEEVKRMALQDILIKQERRAEEELLMEIAVRDALEKKQKEEKGEEQNAESV